MLDLKKLDYGDHLYELGRAVRARRVHTPTQMVDDKTGQTTTAQPGDFVCTYDPPLFKGSRLVSWIEPADEFGQVYLPLEPDQAEAQADAFPDPADVDEPEGFGLEQLERYAKRELKAMAEEKGIDTSGMKKVDLVLALMNTNN